MPSGSQATSLTLPGDGQSFSPFANPTGSSNVDPAAGLDAHLSAYSGAHPSAHPVAAPTSAADALSIDGAVNTISGTLKGIWLQFLGHLPMIVAGFLVLLLTGILCFFLRRSIRKILAAADLRRSLKDLIERFAIIAAWILGVLLAAMLVFPGISPGDGLAALGIGSLAVGLAFKDIFENFFAGILILWRFPFEIDDFIECNGLMGQVVDVTIRNTLIRTVDGRLVIIPNATIYKNPVEVLTSGRYRRITVVCGVAYGENVGKSRKVIEAAVNACQLRATDRDVEVFASEFGDSSINFEVTWWAGATPLSQRRSKDEVVEAVKRALDEAGIEIPFPYRTITFKGPIPVGIVGPTETESAPDARTDAPSKDDPS